MVSKDSASAKSGTAESVQRDVLVQLRGLMECLAYAAGTGLSAEHAAAFHPTLLVILEIAYSD